MCWIRRSVLLIMLCCYGTMSDARPWKTCTASCAKAPEQYAKEYDVVPLGYPYGKDWTGGSIYLGPYAMPVRDQFGWPFTFGYESVGSAGRRKSRHCCK